MDNIVCIEGPVEDIDGKMMLRIPLNVGGEQLKKYVVSISTVDEQYLNIEIKPWLAEKLNIKVGSFVYVDNKEGKFTITRSERNDGI